MAPVTAPPHHTVATVAVPGVGGRSNAEPAAEAVAAVVGSAVGVAVGDAASGVDRAVGGAVEPAAAGWLATAAVPPEVDPQAARPTTDIAATASKLTLRTVGSPSQGRACGDS